MFYIPVVVLQMTLWFVRYTVAAALHKHAKLHTLHVIVITVVHLLQKKAISLYCHILQSRVQQYSIEYFEHVQRTLEQTSIKGRAR